MVSHRFPLFAKVPVIPFAVETPYALPRQRQRCAYVTATNPRRSGSSLIADSPNIACLGNEKPEPSARAFSNNSASSSKAGEKRVDDQTPKRSEHESGAAARGQDNKPQNPSTPAPGSKPRTSSQRLQLSNTAQNEPGSLRRNAGDGRRSAAGLPTQRRNESPSLLEAVGEELSFRWEFAKRGQWRPGAYSAEPYLDTQLKEQDLERYAAAGVLPYLTTLPNGATGLWLLLGRQSALKGGQRGPLSEMPLYLIGGKREVYDISPIHTAAREAAEETEGLLKRVSLQLSLGGARGSPVLWCPQGKYAAYLLPVSPNRMDIDLDFKELTALTPNKAGREVAELVWVSYEELYGEGAQGHLHPFCSTLLNQPALHTFLTSIYRPSQAILSESNPSDSEVILYTEADLMRCEPELARTQNMHQSRERPGKCYETMEDSTERKKGEASTCKTAHYIAQQKTSQPVSKTTFNQIPGTSVKDVDAVDWSKSANLVREALTGALRKPSQDQLSSIVVRGEISDPRRVKPKRGSGSSSAKDVSRTNLYSDPRLVGVNEVSSRDQRGRQKVQGSAGTGLKTGAGLNLRDGAVDLPIARTFAQQKAQIDEAISILQVLKDPIPDSDKCIDS